MRGTRWLLLVAIAAIIYGVGVTYRRQKKSNLQNAVPAQAAMPADINASYGQAFVIKKNQTTGCKVDISSQGMSQATQTQSVALTGVTMRIFHKSGDTCNDRFDLIRSGAATFLDAENQLMAEGDVDIVLGEREEGPGATSLVSIKTSGVSFDTASGKAETEKPSDFVFKNGTGHSTGALYDPTTHELLMKHDVVVDWKPAGEHAKPMHIEAPSLQYHETTSTINLEPSGRMTREDLLFEGDSPTIHLREDDKGRKYLKDLDATHARGTERTATRKLAYSADKVWVSYNDNHLVEHIVAEGHAVLNSTTDTSETNVTGNHVEMFFEPKEKESLLTLVTCNGNAVATSKPVTGPGRLPSETHVLRSESISLKMRAGGRDLETVSANPNGTLEFLPNAPTQHHRTLVGDDFVITYAPQNRLDSFHALNVKTTTEPTADEASHNRKVSNTASRDFVAKFDPQSNQVVTMEQSGNFTYQEGDRRAHANRATYDARQNVMTLDIGAAVSDVTGSTAADHIRLDEKTDDFLAEGNVKSTRLPDKAQKNNSGMLAGDAPLHAEAAKMRSTNRNHHTRYEGGAKLWQDANRITADVVEIDRDKHTLVADGNVVTEAWEQPKDEGKKPAGAAVQTLVHAPHLVYTDQDKLAYYTGGVKLDRTDLHLKSKELKAWLADSKAESQLEKAFADGAVEINGSRKDMTFNGTSEHAEYYTADQKVILNGGAPKLVKTVKGQASTMQQQNGGELIYLINSGNLEGRGAATDRPAKKK